MKNLLRAGRRSSSVLLLLVAGALWACGGSEPGADAGAASDAPAESEAGASGASASGAAPSAGIPAGGLERWISDIRSTLDQIESGDLEQARSRVLQLYVGRQEYIEMFYGEGGQITGRDHPELAQQVLDQEGLFHELMQLTGGQTPEADAVQAKIDELRAQTERTMEAAREAGVPLEREDAGATDGGGQASAEDPDALLASGGEGGAGGAPDQGAGAGASMSEIRAIVAELDEAEAAYDRGDSQAALAGVEHAYLEGFEPIESRLAQANVQRVEKLIHLSLRPRIARGAPAAQVSESFDAVRAELLAADRATARAGSGFWFGAFNSWIIIIREGLEAVLLVGALLAYLAKVEGGTEHRSRIWAGVGLGVLASFATWGVARTLIPVSGGSRELIEGVTALLAVGVLVYVSNWIFQRTYIHHWKDFLKERMDTALTTGSALAMAALAFAAVYREGFETVLFYQALMFDVGSGAVLAGFVPGLLMIALVGWGIVRLGLRLPLRQVFAGTNAILVYLAFVFMGKGLYNLQEAGLFAPHPAAWVPDSEALRLVFGVYPVWETVIGQAALAAVIGATFLWYRSRQSKPEDPAEIETSPARAEAEAAAEEDSRPRPGASGGEKAAHPVAGRAREATAG